MSEQQKTATGTSGSGKYETIRSQIDLLVRVNEKLANELDKQPFNLGVCTAITENARTIGSLVRSLGPSF